MKAVIAGATGFTGSFVTKRLREAGWDVTCFVRPSSDRGSVEGFGVRFATGSLEEPETLAQALLGADALVCVASLGFGHAPGLVQACRSAGIPRAVFFSTTGIFTQLRPGSKSVRLSAEEAIRDSGLDWTILRPTMIYGTGRDRNMCRLVRFLSKSPVMPVLGPGTHLQQPVFVEDLAGAVHSVLATLGTERKAYNLAGASPLTFNDVIETTGKVLGRRVRRVHIPVGPSIAVVSAYERIARNPRLKAEQIRRLNEDKAFPIDEARRDFGYDPIDFPTGIRREIASLRADRA